MQARPTLYKGVQMRSRLEATFAQQADEHGLPWQYEPKCFADAAGQYLPDFLINDVYVEVKPDLVLSDPIALGAALRRMEIVWSSEPDRELNLVVGSGYPVTFDANFCARGDGDRRWRGTSDAIPVWLLVELGD